MSESRHRTPSRSAGRRLNVVLTGFMGTGKTTVGRLLAQELGFEFVDTDALIEERHGPIAEIFASQGEAAFRALEHAVTVELAESDGLVIATGGRMMLDPDNARTLSREGRVFCLVASPEEVLDRVAQDREKVERPLLQGQDPHRRIQDLMAERAAGYRQFPQVTTDGKTPEQVAHQLRHDLLDQPQAGGADGGLEAG